MAEELKACPHGRNFCLECHYDPASPSKTLPQMYDDLLAENAALRAQLPSQGAEAVGVVFTMEALAPGGSVKSHASLNRDLPAGTKLYTHPADQVAQHARDSEGLRSLCAARDQYRELSIKYGDKLNDVLKLLAKCQERLDPHRDAALWGEVCDAFKVKP